MNPWARLVGFGFRLLYNEMAFTYDMVSKAVSLGAWRCWQRTALKYLEVSTDARILELAHGTGDLHLDLYSAGYHKPVGYDLSPNMGAIARRKLMRQGIAACLVRGKVQRLPFPNGVFDAVVCTFPTDFIAERATLHEVHRVLKPGGRFVVVFSGSFIGNGLIVRFLEWLYSITGQHHEKDDSLRSQIYKRLVQFFEESGFTAQVVQEPCPRSQAHLIVAQRTDANPT